MHIISGPYLVNNRKNVSRNISIIAIPVLAFENASVVCDKKRQSESRGKYFDDSKIITALGIFDLITSAHEIKQRV